MEQEQLVSILESIFFVSDKPVTVARFKEVLGEEIAEAQITEALDAVKMKYEQGAFGFMLREAQGGFHFCTKAANVEWVRKFLATKPFRLGRSALEVLSIIAYRQPVTRAEIDKVRGIDSSHLMRTLIERGLVQMAGKADVPGRPVQYGTTRRFLEVTGLSTLGDLPPLSELEQLQGHTEDPNQRLEEGLERFVANTASRSDVPITGEDTSGLGEIEQMISSIRKADEEVYESPEHAEVARENVAAVEGLMAFLPPHRKARKQAAAAEAEAQEQAAATEGTETAEATEGALIEVLEAEVVESNPELEPLPEPPTSAVN